MDAEDLMPVGKCPVCNETVDHSEMGDCKTCGQVFHWSRCGSWYEGEHTCNDCIEAKQKE